MSPITSYRLLSRVDLRPAYTSLGLPESAFRPATTTRPRRLFDCVLNADAAKPDSLWLFKGADYFTFDLMSNDIRQGPQPIAGNWGGDTLPHLFRSGISGAVWGGPTFHKLWYLFKDELFVRLDSTQSWQVTAGPRGVLGVWATGAWCNAEGTYRTPGAPVALHGLGSTFDGTIHFFKDGEYVRHDLRTGQTAAGPEPISKSWALPLPFTERIDLAFYGSGATEENIYFISDDQFVLYDFRTQDVITSGSVTSRFPSFAQFMGRPQLFLVQDYTMEVFVGPTHLGRLIDTRSIGAGSTVQKILVTETTDLTRTSVQQSMLTSQESGVVSDFYDKLDKNTSSTEESDRYRYQLNASAHGEAKAVGIWGGEVDATLAVQGGTDTLRSGLSEAAFSSVGTQVAESKRNVEQKAYNSESEIESSVKVLRKEMFTETNTSDRVRVYDFFEQLQPFLTVMALRRARLAFSDGFQPPRLVDLPAAGALLADVLVDPAERSRVLDYLRGELSNVTDHQGQRRSVVTDDQDVLRMRPGLTSDYAIGTPDGTAQTLQLQGVVVAAHPWVEPTYTITPVQS